MVGLNGERGISARKGGVVGRIEEEANKFGASGDGEIENAWGWK